MNGWTKEVASVLVGVLACFLLNLMFGYAISKAGPSDGEPCYDAAVVADEGTAVDCAPGMRVEFGGMSDGVATVLCRCPSSP